MAYVTHILVIICLYASLATALNLLVGHLGLLSVAQAAFYGFGAYTAALLSMRCGTSIAPELAGVCVASIALAFVISFPSRGLRRDGFAIASFGFQVIFIGILFNWETMTRGPFGITQIPPVRIFNWSVETEWGNLILALLLATTCQVVSLRIVRSPLGRVFHALREDQTYAQVIGKHCLYSIIACFATVACLASLSGMLYAHYISYIDPTSFTVNESILVLSMVIIGGAGSSWGPLVGAVVLVILPELLRFVGLPSATAANLRQIVYGAALVGCMVWRPQGLMGEYDFGRGDKRK